MALALTAAALMLSAPVHAGSETGPVLESRMGPVLASARMEPVIPQEDPADAEMPKGPRISLSLAGAVEMGLSSNETLKQAGEALLGAEASVSEAKSGRIPTLDLAAQYGRNLLVPIMFIPPDMGEAFGGVTKIEVGMDNDISSAANLTWNAWTGGRVSSAIGVTSAVAEAVRSGEIAVADYVKFGITDAYFSVLLADAILRINEAAFQTTLEAVRVARAGHESGTVSRFDLLRAEVELENRESPMIVARNDLEQALYTLKRRCGIDPSVELALTDSLGYVDKPEDIGTLLARMRETNPELIAVEHQVMAAEMNVKLEKAARWPTLQLGANYVIQGQWNDGVSLSTDNLAHMSTVSAAFVWPIFDGLKSKARIDRARADLRSAEVELGRVSKDKELAVRVSRMTLVNAITALQGREEAVSLAEEAYRLAEVRLNNGLATPLERLDAELAMTTARGQYAQALYAANIARAALELTLGGGTAGQYHSAARKESGDE
jgi:outer membrane protein TolC